jgi:hypothetical protein
MTFYVRLTPSLDQCQKVGNVIQVATNGDNSLSFKNATGTETVLCATTGGGNSVWYWKSSGTSKIVINPGTPGVAIGATATQANCILLLTSTTQALLVPRMTSVQKGNVASAEEGMIVYDLTLHKLCVFGAASWETISSV